jgi:hypothetical protein
MADTSPHFKPTQNRRREAFWRGFSVFVGCTAVTVLIAALVFAVSQRLVRGPSSFEDEEYLQSRYSLQQGQGNWSQNTESAPALFGPSTAASEAPTAAPTATEPRMSGIADIEQKREKISALLSQYFSAMTVEERLLHVRDAERVEPLMRAYHEREPMPAYRLRDLGWLVRVDEPGYRFGYVQALFEDATPASLVVEELEDGRMVIDWECLVRYGELAWADFQRMRPAQPTLMRLIASRPAATLGATMAAQGEWLELRHPAESGTILGWFDKTDPKFAGLLEQLQTGNWKDVPVTLRVCFPEPPAATSRESVRIAGVEGKGWLILAGKPNG